MTDEQRLEFCLDFSKVANDEALHYSLLLDRLKSYDSYFGALSVHGALWESASTTSKDILERLAIVHMVHEVYFISFYLKARGLDVNPSTISKFKKAQDEKSVEFLTKIHQDEVTHVACGAKWFQIHCRNLSIDSPVHHFHSIIRKLFRGKLKPPFNKEDRDKAGLSEEWYICLQE
jgi:uncharacterized ferritin-like protein (DUF455 family)